MIHQRCVIVAKLLLEMTGCERLVMTAISLTSDAVCIPRDICVVIESPVDHMVERKSCGNLCAQIECTD